MGPKAGLDAMKKRKIPNPCLRLNLGSSAVQHHSCYIPFPSHPPRLHHSNYTWRRVQVMKPLIMQFKPWVCRAPCSYVHLQGTLPSLVHVRRMYAYMCVCRYVCIQLAKEGSNCKDYLCLHLFCYSEYSIWGGIEIRLMCYTGK
jgi:hypothetical protein